MKFILFVYKISLKNQKAALHVACENNNLEIVRQILMYPEIDVNLLMEIFSIC